MRQVFGLVGGLALAASLLGGAARADDAASARVDPALPEYTSSPGVSGGIKTQGSDTMLNMAGHWGEAFASFYPAVRLQMEGKGSSTAPPALLERQAQFGLMSRAMEPEELALFVERQGFEPTQLRVAIDCVAVFVNADCPLDEISLEQIEQVFSVSGPDMTWGDLGVDEAGWRDRPISLYARNSASGTYKFFKKAAMGRQDFKPSVKESPGSAGVIGAVGGDRYGIGYSGVGYGTSTVKALRISFSEGEEAFTPNVEYAYSGDYPLARFMYVYLNRDPREPIDPLREAFVRMIFSRQGQEAVLRDGAYPVSAELARRELEKLGLTAGF
ncbi:MAG: phosphate ABC transporter substrate-binding protein [Planctomycetota bacterium]